MKQIKAIKTNSPVSAIVQDKDSVTVKVGAVGYSADYVVLAVPLKALGKIQMTPALDAQHMGAIKSTNYGWRDQIMLKFKTPVWESKARMSGEIYSNTGLGMLWIEPATKGGANVVINLAGDNARIMQAFGDKHRAFSVSLWQDDDKLVSAKAGRSIDCSQFCAQAIGQHAESFIAGFVSSLIVDVFEVIEVEHD